LGSEGGEMGKGNNQTGFEELCEYKNNRIYFDQCFHKKWQDSKYCVFHALCEDGLKSAENEGKRLSTYIEEITAYYGYELEAYKKLIAERDETVELDCKGFVFPPNLKVLEGKIWDRNINFAGAKFLGQADFELKTFKKKVNFSWAEFDFGGEFDGAVFEETPVFIHTVFGSRKYTSKLWASFAGTHFEKGALFWGCEFNAEAYFVDLVTSGDLIFKSVEFRDSATFKRAIFGSNVHFIRVVKNMEKTYPGPVFEIIRVIEPAAEVDFTEVTVEKGKRLLFKGFDVPPVTRIDLGEWAFADTEAIENANFIDVDWFGNGDPKRKHTLDEKRAKKGDPPFETAAEVYRRLRLNYERRLAYEGASDFHIGQMEMLLLNPATSKPKKFFLWWYKWISNFGESVNRPLWWLVGVWAAFFVIWLILPAHHELAGVSAILKSNFDWPWEWLSRTRFPDLTELFWYVWRKFWFTASNFITFPRTDGTYFERFLGGFQRFLGVTVVTFFILALRRAFRR